MLPALSSARPASADPNLFYSVDCGETYDLCGYTDARSGDVLIPHQFERAMRFREDLAAVRLNGVFGYIDRSGEMVIAHQFELAGKFHQGLAEVRINGRSGVIDTTGRMVLDAEFARAIPFTKDTVLIESGEVSYLEAMQRSGFPPKNYGPLDHRTLPGLNGFLSFVRLDHVETGTVSIGGSLLSWIWPSSSSLRVKTFDKSGGDLIWAQHWTSWDFLLLALGIYDDEERSKEKPWGLLQSDGNWRVEPSFARVGQVSDGLAIIKDADGRTGAVDSEGNMAIPFRSEGLSRFENGFAVSYPSSNKTPAELRAERRKILKEGGTPKQPSRKIVDRTGTLIADRWFDKIRVFKHQDYDGPAIARVSIEDGDIKGLTRDGTLIDDPLFGLNLFTCASGIQGRWAGGRTYELIGPDGDPISDHIFELEGYEPTGAPSGLKHFRYTCPTVLKSKKNERYTLLTSAGELVPETPSFQYVRPLGDGFLTHRKNGKWGLMRLDGEILIPAIHRDDLIPYLGGFITVGDDDEWLRLDVEGNVLPMPMKGEVYRYCNGNRANRFSRDGKWGLVHESGRVLVEPRFDALTCFIQGRAWAVDPDNKQWCPVTSEDQLDKTRCKKDFIPAYNLLKDMLENYDFDHVLKAVRADLTDDTVWE